jgi:hemerythrin-like metal-binding protein
VFGFSGPHPEWGGGGLFMAESKRRSVHSVFTPALDAEHRNISNAIEALRRMSGEEGGGPLTFLRSLAERIEEHFAGEERLMRSSRYPSYDWHKRQHDAARKRVTEFAARAEANEAGAVSAAASFLAGWLRDHTGLHDRMMAAYLRNYERARGRAVAR